LDSIIYPNKILNVIIHEFLYFFFFWKWKKKVFFITFCVSLFCLIANNFSFSHPCLRCKAKGHFLNVTQFHYIEKCHQEKKMIKSGNISFYILSSNYPNKSWKYKKVIWKHSFDCQKQFKEKMGGKNKFFQKENVHIVLDRYDVIWICISIACMPYWNFLDLYSTSFLFMRSSIPRWRGRSPFSFWAKNLKIVVIL
jgi:hypothetical protein